MSSISHVAFLSIIHSEASCTHFVGPNVQLVIKNNITRQNVKLNIFFILVLPLL